MNLRHLALEVERVFKQADELATQVQAHAGLTCPQGCGRCCDNPAIEVYPIEFLPLAIYLHENNLAESFLEDIDKQETDLCPLYKPSGHGGCTAYQYRGLICRLMGYTAMRSKHGKATLIACGVFKETQALNIPLAEGYINATAAPYASQFYERLQYIAPFLATEMLPVKQAVKAIIEYVEKNARYEGEDAG